MKPLIKWPGGKSAEIRQFLPFIPEKYDRYIEPFVGGGALYFQIRPERAVLGDISENLIAFYRLIGRNDAAFRGWLEQYDEAFTSLRRACESAGDRLMELFLLFEYARETHFSAGPLHICKGMTDEICHDPAFWEAAGGLVPDEAVFFQIMEKSVEEKYLRTLENHLKNAFSPLDLQENILTGFLGGFYLYSRSVFNDLESGRLQADEAFRVANFYFVREYCYGSMFRYNRNGEFNIPYGGISYNRKNFREKINRIFAPETTALLSGAVCLCCDFEEQMAQLELTENDFLFLDPPYDTRFHEYEGHAFDRHDQKRLADFLKQTPARFLLVIKNTDYIYSLYEGHFQIFAFENQYLYNVRRRNERKAEHLLITNIQPGKP